MVSGGGGSPSVFTVSSAAFMTPTSEPANPARLAANKTPGKYTPTSSLHVFTRQVISSTPIKWWAA